ncbi:translation elongation factor Ts [Candidatus Saccharibacteria bacterium]|nr:translation elongation factor Ts [Candidatus Saccharibacteria bacterium]NIV03082.1 translation elongation factor Ts [Calditrichia bacterium]NIV72733.1 translation elongation factor Ts [Calditrichia bacterium]NIV98093.1 translation elongation factor Ts [Candidatus Saccharibacteria bacterium]NIW78380.1 translation elongation factor Ts [Calditrichia bacterium]
MANITAEMVKELREKTGAGMMDCKKALQETNGQLEKAVDFLRKKGIAKAEKKASREVKDGLVEAYIHAGGKLGVLVEVNCETDFVAKTEEFREFARNIAMQIAATNPLGIRREDIAQEVVDREAEIFKEQAKASGKPEHVIDKIAEGKLGKFYSENALMEQAYIRNPDMAVEDYLKEMIGKIGENITISRFARFRIGDD